VRLLSSRYSRVPWVEVATAWARHQVAGRFRRRPLPPRAMHLLATGRCGARCVMCGIWKTGQEKIEDLPLAEWDRIFGDRLFSTIEFAGISGGEPFLRSDLSDLLIVLHKHSPRLKRLSVTSNGTVPHLMEKVLERLVPYCRKNGLLLDISVSMHGLGEVFERITGVPRAAEKAMETFSILNPLWAGGDLTRSINAVLLRQNLDQARDLAAWAQKQQIPISFVVGEQRSRFRNEEMAEAFVPEAERAKLLAFLKEMSRDLSLRKLHAMRYRNLVRMMEKEAPRSMPCYYALGGFVLGHDGELYYCSHSRSVGNCRDRSAWNIYYDPANLVYRRQDLLGHECAGCPPYTLTRWEIEVHAHKVATELLLERVRRSFA
jgi:Fe-coproporphyrin III synthase